MAAPQSSKSILLQEERRHFVEERLLRGPWLIVCALGGKIAGFESHIQFVRDLLDLRAGSAHRKDEKYKKAAAIFQIEGRDLRIVGKEIFDHAVDFMKFLEFIVPAPRT